MEIVATFVPKPGADGAVIADELARLPVGATAVELRVDLLPRELDLASLVGACPCPVVVTLRSRAEGGEGPEDVAARHAFFSRVVSLPVMAFDLEAERDMGLLAGTVPRERAILSVHPPGVPGDLLSRVAALQARRPLLVKVAPRVETLNDLLDVLRIARAVGAAGKVVVLGTGEAGRAARLLGPLLAAPIAYAAWGPDRAGAPGQYTPAELRDLIGHLQGAPSRLLAILGRPVAHSLSPRMHNAAYRAAGTSDLMVPIEVGSRDELIRLAQPAGLTALDGLGFAVGGFAVTMPWKEEAVACCSLVAPRAQRARAVNTVLPRRGKVLGDCTDIDGIGRALAEAGVSLEGGKALVLGTGGSARAAVVALQGLGCDVAVTGRDLGKAAAVAASLGAQAIAPGEAGRCTVAVNSTPAGGGGSDSELLATLHLADGATVVDLPYGDVPTRLQVLAAENGWSYVGGREVLLWQGVAQLAAMTGIAPPVRAMASALGLDAGEAS